MLGWLKRIFRRDQGGSAMTLMLLSASNPVLLQPEVLRVADAESKQADSNPQPLRRGPIILGPSVEVQPVAIEDVNSLVEQFPLIERPIDPHPPILLAKPISPENLPRTVTLTTSEPVEIEPGNSTPPTRTESPVTALATASIGSPQRYYWNWSDFYPSQTSLVTRPPPALPRRQLAQPHQAASNAESTSLPQATPTPAVRPALPLSRFISVQIVPANAPEGTVVSLDPILYSSFLMAEEGSSQVSQAAAQNYLSNAKLAEEGRRLRDRVLASYMMGKAPLTADALLALAQQVATHPGTALLLCHNVTRSFARGGDTIAWRNTGRNSGQYSAETATYTATPRNRQGRLRATAVSPPSIFYLLFSTRVFGMEDPGDWYRFFALATLVAYATASQIQFDATTTSSTSAAMAALLERIALLIEDTQQPASSNTAWLWANSLCFAEWGLWGRNQATAEHAARLAISAARFGFAAAGAKPAPPAPPWCVPVVGSIRNEAHESIGASSIASTIPAESPGDGLCA